MIKRLNVGCGPQRIAGWLNADLHTGPGIDVVGDIRTGLNLDTDSIDYIVAMHMLQDLRYPDIPVALRELKRVLIPGGVLRLGLPDLEKAIRAYIAGDHGYFHVPDGDARAIGTKLVTQIIWYGSVRTPFTFDCIAEWLSREGFRLVRRCGFGLTESAYPEIVHLDNRPRESLFVEATK
ncbi:MAG TPA: methyltransferase domain-containing protein [Nitrospira sp.]|nr:methyltransferase domain-containing protein [Nitrospira sp.]